MAEARERSAWSRTANIMCILANTNRDPKRRAYKPTDFNPYASRQRKAKPPEIELTVLKDVFCHGR